MQYSGPERRENTLDRQLSELGGRVRGLEEGMFAIRSRQGDIHDRVNEMYQVFDDARGGFRTLSLIGKGAKPILYIGALCSAILVGVKTGIWNFRP